MLIAAALAKLMRLNTILTLVASNISIPPMIPIILFLSYWCGGIVINDSIELSWNSELTLEDVYLNLKQYIIGALIFGAAAGLSIFFCFIRISCPGKKE